MNHIVMKHGLAAAAALLLLGCGAKGLSSNKRSGASDGSAAGSAAAQQNAGTATATGNSGTSNLVARTPTQLAQLLLDSFGPSLDEQGMSGAGTNGQNGQAQSYLATTTAFGTLTGTASAGGLSTTINVSYALAVAELSSLVKQNYNLHISNGDPGYKDARDPTQAQQIIMAINPGMDAASADALAQELSKDATSVSPGDAAATVVESLDFLVAKVAVQ